MKKTGTAALRKNKTKTQKKKTPSQNTDKKDLCCGLGVTLGPGTWSWPAPGIWSQPLTDKCQHHTIVAAVHLGVTQWWTDFVRPEPNCEHGTSQDISFSVLRHRGGDPEHHTPWVRAYKWPFASPCSCQCQPAPSSRQLSRRLLRMAIPSKEAKSLLGPLLSSSWDLWQDFNLQDLNVLRY